MELIYKIKGGFYAKHLKKTVNELIKHLYELGLIKTANITDGNHILKQLYRQRELFRVVCHNYFDLAWKSKYDINGNFISEDTFMAGINTPLGPVCYVLNDERFNQFEIEQISKAPMDKNVIYQDVTKKLSSIKIRQFENK